MSRIQVLLVTYNHAPFISRALESIILQTHEDIDLIILNDYSTDETGQVIDAFYNMLDKRTDGHYTYIRMDANLGAVGAFHLITQYYANHPQSDYVCILEGDDFWLPDALEKRLKAIKEQDYDAVHSDVHEFTRSHITRNFWKHHNRDIQSPISKKQLLDDNRIFTCSLLTKNELFKKSYDFGLFDRLGIKLCDYAACLRMVEMGATIGYLNEATAVYRNVETSLTHSMTHDKLIEETNKVKEMAKSGVLFEGLDV